MTTIEQHLCNVMWKFVKEHFEEIKESPKNLGFKNKTDMLNAIKVNWQDAWWALFELCSWGMERNYIDKFLITEGDSYNIYKIGRRYFKKPYHEDGIVEVKQVVKTVKVIDWEEVK